MYTEELRQEGFRRIRLSRELKAEMVGLSPSEMSKRFRLEYNSVLAIRDGKPVNTRKVTERQKRFIADATRRHAELSAQYRTLDEIAADLGVSRRCVTKWCQKLGLSGRGAPKAKKIETVLDEPMTPEVEFLTMRLTRNPAGVVGYY